MAIPLNGKPIHCSEVKTGFAPINPRQAGADSWINANRCPAELFRYPGCPINLYDYAKYFR